MSDTGRTWRDIADQLTSEQIAYYEMVEREGWEETGETNDEFWLKQARRDAESNMIERVMDVRLPPDASRDFGHVVDGVFVQFFEGTRREVLDVGAGWCVVPESTTMNIRKRRFSLV